MLDTLTHQHLAPELLRTFVAAADSGSFTGAARLVHRTQSAVSMQVKRLEEDLGRELFARGARGVALTPDGETLYRFARRILRLYDEAAASLAAPELTGVVRFGAPEDYAASHLPGILARFASVYPLVRVDVFCDATEHLLARLADGTLDLCLATSADGLDGGRPVLDMPLRWLGPEHGMPGEGGPLPVAVFHEGCVYRHSALEALERRGIAYRVAYVSPGVGGVLAAVRAGLAVAPMAEGVEAAGCRVIGAAQGLPALPSVRVTLHLRAGALPPAVEGLAGHVDAAVRGEGTVLSRPSAP